MCKGNRDSEREGKFWREEGECGRGRGDEVGEEGDLLCECLLYNNMANVSSTHIPSVSHHKVLSTGMLAREGVTSGRVHWTSKRAMDTGHCSRLGV